MSLSSYAFRVLAHDSNLHKSSSCVQVCLITVRTWMYVLRMHESNSYVCHPSVVLVKFLRGVDLV